MDTSYETELDASDRAAALWQELDKGITRSLADAQAAKAAAQVHQASLCFLNVVRQHAACGPGVLCAQHPAHWVQTICEQ